LKILHGFQKFISEIFINGEFPKILPSKNFPLYGIYTYIYFANGLKEHFNQTIQNMVVKYVQDKK